MLGADPVRAARELKESLTFEIRLANASLPREERRNASRLYNPMKLDSLNNIAPIVNWTTYVNNVLTKDLLQVISVILCDLALSNGKFMIIPFIHILPDIQFPVTFAIIGQRQ